MSELTEITETAQDTVIEAIESPKDEPEQGGWHKTVALTTLVMALLAALGGLLAGMTANNALLTRTAELIKMSSMESDRQYVETLNSKHEILAALGKTPDPAEVQKIAAYREETRELEAETARVELQAQSAASAHLTFSTAITLLSLGITLGGMAVVVERKWLWMMGLAVGGLGTVGLGVGIIQMLL
jgi:hypothetical protein